MYLDNGVLYQRQMKQVGLVMIINCRKMHAKPPCPRIAWSEGAITIIG